MNTNQYIDYKAKKLGVNISHEERTVDGETYEIWSFTCGNNTYPSFSLRELEDTLDDCLDGGFYRQAEAEADRRFVDMAYGFGE